jgi:hypothetical protein
MYNNSCSPAKSGLSRHDFVLATHFEKDMIIVLLHHHGSLSRLDLVLATYFETFKVGIRHDNNPAPSPWESITP